MASVIAPLKDTAVELPWKLLVAAAQPYQTLSGPALSVNFLRQPTLMPFQRLPFCSCDVPGRYFHSLLHSLAEFATTPRPVRGSHVKMLHAPMEDFWRSVGVLNCVYYTRYYPFGAEHPVMGAVELASPSHRKQKDVRLSLYNGTHQPMASMIITGALTDASDRLDDGAHAPLPHGGHNDESLKATLLGAVRRSADGSIFQQALFATSDELSGDVVPPWKLDGCVAEFCQVLVKAGLLAPHVSSDRHCVWTIVAQQTLAYGELLPNESFEIVSATPRVFAKYHMPPWRHRIGLPLLSGDAQRLCVALRVEVRQNGRVLNAGTYFFSEAGTCV